MGRAPEAEIGQVRARAGFARQLRLVVRYQRTHSAARQYSTSTDEQYADLLPPVIDSAMDL
jgi:hypothetical protein